MLEPTNVSFVHIPKEWNAVADLRVVPPPGRKDQVCTVCKVCSWKFAYIYSMHFIPINGVDFCFESYQFVDIWTFFFFSLLLLVHDLIRRLTMLWCYLPRYQSRKESDYGNDPSSSRWFKRQYRVDGTKRNNNNSWGSQWRSSRSKNTHFSSDFRPSM